CLLDTGYDYRRHQAFQKLDVIATRDFLHGDTEVADEVGQDVGDTQGPQHAHGTQTLSVIGGYDPGRFVGIAYDAEFMLGKTENVASETPIEEDFWVAGVEWADSLGADIVSSSLGYNTWDPGTGSDYTLDDLNGETAKTTRAAAIAIRKGVVVVASAGNEGNDAWQKVLTPADGKDVVAVGAIDSQGFRAPFSSLGPTADGRMKPDVVALGVGVWAVDVVSPAGYVQRNGTSFSCPLVSGVCALLLQAHPEWTPVHVGRALRETARDLGPADPDTLYGWGVVDALAAANFESDSTLVPDEPELPGEVIDGIVVYPPFPNPSSGEVYFPFKHSGDTHVGLEVFTPSGELVARVGPQSFYGGRYEKWGLVWNGENGEYNRLDERPLRDRDSTVSPGIYFYRLDFEGKMVVGKVALVR
ncbi:MAG: S8 family serine peptidase, partial [Candidatus Latescibacteria bacterium]|nr:S8 family serine peptidase [Candidatus Latescibacterota bacterium]